MITRRKQTAFIRRLLYTLKQGYGFPITLHKITNEELDYRTGNKAVTTVTQKISKAIILPANLQRVFESDSLPAGFKYGALFDTSLRKIIIDATDLNDFEIEILDYFIWNEKRWEVSQVSELEFQTIYIIFARMVEGTKRHMVEEVTLESNLQLTSTVEEE